MTAKVILCLDGCGPESLGGGHLLDAVGMQIGVEQLLEFLPGGLPAEDILDHPEEFMIFPIEEKFRKKMLHGEDLEGE